MLLALCLVDNRTAWLALQKCSRGRMDHVSILTILRLSYYFLQCHYIRMMEVSAQHITSLKIQEQSRFQFCFNHSRSRREYLRYRNSSAEMKSVWEFIICRVRWWNVGNYLCHDVYKVWFFFWCVISQCELFNFTVMVLYVSWYRYFCCEVISNLILFYIQHRFYCGVMFKSSCMRLETWPKCFLWSYKNLKIS